MSWLRCDGVLLVLFVCRLDDFFGNNGAALAAILGAYSHHTTNIRRPVTAAQRSARVYERNDTIRHDSTRNEIE